MLDDLGHSAIEAGNGMRALEILAARPDGDLVIIDQGHTWNDGSAGRTRHQTSSKHLRPELRVILAGYAEFPGGFPAEIHRLGKPCRRTDLVDAIAAAVS